MNKDQFIDQFLEELPELREPYAREFQNMRLEREDGIYAIWIFGIMSCVKERLKAPEENQALLKRIFQFFEKMAASEDDEVQSLLLCGTLESLDDTPQMVADACVLMGPKTKMLWNQLQDFWNLRGPGGRA